MRERENLAGQAPPGRYIFRDDEGNRLPRTDAIFPIFRYKPDEALEFVGTGFFIPENGLFVTAKHVLDAAYDEEGCQTHYISLIQFTAEGYCIRPIVAYSSHHRADLSLGVAAPAFHNKSGLPLANSFLKLTLHPPRPGERVCTYAYPDTRIKGDGSAQSLYCSPGFYEGHLDNYLPDGANSPVTIIAS